MDFFRGRHIPQTERGPSQKVRAAPQQGSSQKARAPKGEGVCRQSVGQLRGQALGRSVFTGRGTSQANEWEGYSNYFLEGVEIYRIWSITHSLVFGQCLGTVMAPWVCHFTCCLRIKSWSCLPSWSHLI